MTTKKDAKKLTWHTEKRKVGELVPFEGNPRIMNDKQLEDLKKSVSKFDAPRDAVCMMRQKMAPKSAKTMRMPTNPHSSANAAKIKSV